ncbi:MAG: type I-E CRISPR-associated protein Cse1/CasA [Steroidobacteraceae bacterium]
MSYDLRFESWIPFRRASGGVDWLPPSGLTERLAEDPIIALACPRADFDAAVLEFLIGLFSVAIAPENEPEWEAVGRAPPSPAALRAALSRLPDAFALDGDSARAFQDLDPLDGVEATPIENLLIDAAGEQARRRNTDLFAKRDRILSLGRPAAAMALVTMQTYAPSGGQGHRTSLRGGGPLTTLAEPRAQPRTEPLWRLIWANAESVAQFDERDGGRARAWSPADTFPWLAPTRTSYPKERGVPTYPTDAAPGQAYFGLPRRIRLEITQAAGICALTGLPDTTQIKAFRMKNYGVQYTGWRHPLTPYYYDKQSGLLPEHGQPGGVAWRDWQGLLFDSADESGSRPAQAIAHYRARRADGPFRILVFGYDVDKMKARSWIQAELPAFPDAMLESVRAFTDAATAAAQLLATVVMFAVKAALLQRPKDAPGDYRYLKQALWARTQAPFFDLVGEVTQVPNADGPAMRERFRHVLREAALTIFDLACPLTAGLESSHLRRPIAARHRLVMTLEGFGKDGSALFKALNLAPPEIRKAKKQSAA